MNIYALVPIAVGAGIGALLGRTRKCATGSCPLTANPKRGALWGGFLGLLVALNMGLLTAHSTQIADAKQADGTSMVAAIASPEDFTQQVLAREGKTAVIFHAKWCPACKQFDPIAAKVAKDLYPGVVFRSVDTDEQSDLAARYGVEYLPTTLIFEHGKVVNQLVGAVSEEDLRAALSH